MKSPGPNGGETKCRHLRDQVRCEQDRKKKKFGHLEIMSQFVAKRGGDGGFEQQKSCRADKARRWRKKWAWAIVKGLGGSMKRVGENYCILEKGQKSMGKRRCWSKRYIFRNKNFKK